MKLLADYEPYQNYYHFGASTKYRKNLFYDEVIRTRLKTIIGDIIAKNESIELVESTVAYNHVHILLKSDLAPSKIAQVLFGTSSYLLRKEFPILVEKVPKGLWGGKNCLPIKDEEHLKNCIMYIRRHQPDNTKVD